VTRQAIGIFAETSFDYVDCLMLAMRRGGQVDEVFTFDKQLLKSLDAREGK
jgi:predicted nucleic-acid-binding protein